MSTADITMTAEGKGERGGRRGGKRGKVGERERDGEEGDIREEDLHNYMICKRVPQRLPTRPNDIYVCRNTRYVAMVTRAQKLLDSGWNEIYIHGLGAAISHAINLALQLKERGAGTISLDTHTDTVQLCDDFIPATE
eukprot:Ihof_evm4s550 gene=Ihof_evmTU4s550